MCKLLAERHQFYQSTFNTGEDYLSHGNLVSTCGSNVSICLLDNQIQQLLADIIQEESIFLCKSVKFFGIFFALFVQLQLDTKMKNRKDGISVGKSILQGAIGVNITGPIIDDDLQKYVLDSFYSDEISRSVKSDYLLLMLGKAQLSKLGFKRAS